MSYRPLITAEQNKAFDQALSRAIPTVDLSAVGFIGTIGSMSKDAARFGHDIDLVMFPKPEASLGNTMSNVDDLLSEVDSIMRTDYGLTLSPSGRKLRQEVNWLEVQKATGLHPLMVHRLVYPDKQSFLSIEPKGFFECAKAEARPYFGTWNAIEENPVRDQGIIDAQYWIEWYDLGSYATPGVLKRNPQLLFMEAASAFEYINKHHTMVDTKLENVSVAELRKLVRDARHAIDRMAA